MSRLLVSGRGLALLCLLVLLGAGTVLLTRGARGADAPRARVAQGEPEAGFALLSAREPLALSSAPELGTARAYLADYHGARWPALEAAMERARLPLDQPFTPQPWEEVELAVREQMRLDDSMRRRLENKDWVSPLTNEWLQGEYALASDVVLDGTELSSLESELAICMQALERADRSYADQLDFHLQSAFERGDFVRAPFSTLGLDEEQGFFCKGIASGTWAASVVLRDEECPDLVDLREEIRVLEDERDRRVQTFLRARRAR